MPASRIVAVLLYLAGSSLAPSALAAVDCLPDEVVYFTGGYAPPEAGQRVAELPGIALGPPGDSFPVTGSTSTVSLGRGGSILIAFTDIEIVDGPGPDFIVFENAFFRSSVPADPNASYTVFAEVGSVAVSANGIDFFQFPYDPNAPGLVGQDATPSWALPALRGLAGITPTFTGNWTVPDDPDIWDPAGRGGVSGAGGDAFDLAAVGLASARYVLITDLGLATGFAGPAEGFDLDAIVALHAVPTPPDLFPAPARTDSDGDGLSDIEEAVWHGTDPMSPDTDGDGENDGAEVARCRSPLSSSTAPYVAGGPDLRVRRAPGSTDTFVTWTFVGSSVTYDVARGVLAGAGSPLPSAVICIEDNSFNLTTADHPDTGLPSTGAAFFYVVRPSGSSSYGKGSGGGSRLFSSGDCPP